MGEGFSDGHHGEKVVLWRQELDNHPGLLATTLEPLAAAGAELQVVMAYRYPGEADKAAIELHPVASRKSTAAAKTAGLAPSAIPALLVQGDNRQGLGHALAKALGDAGINLSFVMAQGWDGDMRPCSASSTRPTPLGRRP
jgi:hypothetical protein